MATQKCLFTNEPDRTKEALGTFENIRSCFYTIPNIGSSGQQEIISCDCVKQISSEHNGLNIACGEDSDCINRLTSVECVNSSRNSCGTDCQNQRFQKRQYSDISIFQTEKKGYGVRANRDLQEGQFIYEYIGEVINETEFRKRMIQYDREGVKHFYFMMLQKDQFIDATKKGCLARFCNHSCLPNAYVDKWVVGNRLRMGIFAKRYIQKGEEICFDYNVDRYGADPQPCYCEEPNCIGFLGGKTQTESANLLPKAIADALGISSSDEKEWLKYKKRDDKSFRVNNNSSNINEEFVKGCMMKPLSSKDVPKVMAVLMLPNKDDLVIRKLIERLYLTQFEDDEDELASINRSLIRLHGFKAICLILKEVWSVEDMQTTYRILTILNNWHCKTKNKIVSSGIEDIIIHIADCTVPDYDDENDNDNDKKVLNERDDDEIVTRSDVHEKAVSLADAWSRLQVEFKIKKTSPSAEPGQRIVAQSGLRTLSLRRSQTYDDDNDVKPIDNITTAANKNYHKSSVVYEDISHAPSQYKEPSVASINHLVPPAQAAQAASNISHASYSKYSSDTYNKYKYSKSPEYKKYSKDQNTHDYNLGFQPPHDEAAYNGRSYRGVSRAYSGRGGRPYSRGRGYSSRGYLGGDRTYSIRGGRPYSAGNRPPYIGYEKQKYNRSFEEPTIGYSGYNLGNSSYPPQSINTSNVQNGTSQELPNEKYYSRQSVTKSNHVEQPTLAAPSKPTAVEKQRLADEVFKTVVKNATEANKHRIEEEMKLRQNRDLPTEASTINGAGSSTNGNFSTPRKIEPKRLSEHSLHKLWSKQFAVYVPNMVKGYSENKLNKDEIKDLSRSLVQNLASKELKRHQTPPSKTFKEDKVTKIRVFVKDYMKKYISKKSSKQLSKRHLDNQGYGERIAPDAKRVKD